MIIHCNIEKSDYTETETLKIISTKENSTIKENGYKLEFQENSNLEIQDLKSIFGESLDILKISVLSLKGCDLNFLPDALSTLPLVELDISYNNFSEVPKCLVKGLESIKILNLGSNYIKFIDTDLKCCKNLTFLDLQNNRLKSLPKFLTFDNCPKLGYVNLSQNAIGPFLNLDVFKNLLKLHLNNCKIVNLKIIYSIWDLRVLEIGNVADHDPNSINDISFKSFASKSTLVELNLTGLGLSKLDDTLSALINLENLNLSKNSVYELPNITNPKLKVLNLSYNNLIELNDLPTTLEELYLSNNALNNLNFELPNLKVLDIYNNYVTDPIRNDLTSKLALFDLEQNYIDTSLFEEDYNLKKCELRSLICEVGRSNGQKNFSDECYDRFSSSSYSSDLSLGHSDVNRDYVSFLANGEIEEENWDTYETDDELYLEPLKVFTVPRQKTYFYNDMLCDPSCFDDAPEDSS